MVSNVARSPVKGITVILIWFWGSSELPSIWYPRIANVGAACANALPVAKYKAAKTMTAGRLDKAK